MMKKDKGCFNEACENYQKKIKFLDSDSYCPKCGKQLQYVCINHKCFKHVEGPAMLCRTCEIENDEKRERFMKNAAGAASLALGGITVVLKYGKQIAKAGAKVLTEVIKK